MRAAVLAALGGCWSGASREPPPRVTEQPPVVELVVATGRTIQFLASAPRGGLTERRTVAAPATVQALRWLDRDLVVLAHEEGSGVPRVGIVSPAGYTPLGIPEKSAWPDLQKPDMDHFNPPQYRIETTVANEVWLGRCEWGWFADGGSCVEWAWARLAPDPVSVGTRAPVERPPLYALAPVRPSSRVRAELVDHRDPTGSTVDPPAKFLRCTQDGVAREFPSRDARSSGDFLGVDEILWISTEPPMFRVARKESCLAICTIYVTFEGCEPSRQFGDARLIAGPAGVFALAGEDRVSVRWRGKEIGVVREAVTHIAFAPPVKP